MSFAIGPICPEENEAREEAKTVPAEEFLEGFERFQKKKEEASSARLCDDELYVDLEKAYKKYMSSCPPFPEVKDSSDSEALGPTAMKTACWPQRIPLVSGRWLMNTYQ